MVEIRYTKHLFLRCMNVIYLFAFASIYIQIPGLYGENGVLPAHVQLEAKDDNLVRNIHNKPTLLWLAPYIGLDTEYMMDVLALTGIFLSFTGFVSQKFCNKPMFAALWSLYYSLYQVGQTFLWFQWDILLLEAGVLCVLASPLRYKPGTRRRPTPLAPHEPVTFWLVRWLLFRLLFSSGIVKLTSGCPQWWGLTALNVHFESMCLPAPLAWYCFHLPAWFLNLNTVFANVAEIFIPPLFFFPVQSVRTVAFWVQAFLQVCIIISGNFNFFNFLTLTLCLSLCTDKFFLKIKKQEKSSRLLSILSFLTAVVVYGTVIYATVVLYTLKYQDGKINSKIAFTKKEFDLALSKGLPAVIVVGLASLVITSLQALLSAVSQTSSSFFSKLFSLLSTLFYITASAFIFTDSLVPFSTLHPSGNATVLPVVRDWHTRLSHLHVTNAYGLFRRMTGVGGRPEIIIEGSNDVKGPWLEYHFLYKPGDVNRSPPFVAPHQPRLDWQMWFAALGTYHQNPWLMSLTYRILTNQKEVLALMDQAHNPFKQTPPKYLRATLYHYHYTTWDQRTTNRWWTREKVGEYFPVFSKDHPPLLDYLRNLKMLSKDKHKAKVNPYAKNFLDQLRALFANVDGGILLWSLFSAGMAVTMLEGFSSPATTPHSKKNN
ncbi:lipase maturation factor 2-like [Macrosteles quadrilineatus]|uniref:lipase maturation factor 2-like n=1 Tax=Macrosteles quadrilineatus TaxID=74068 RepID=UPI0023E0F5C9|nr:lipase maturation factor 2-like [Macrosteles quadrilineatus]